MKLHIVLTKSDRDILAFKKSLPKGEWSKTVAIILNAALKGEVATLPMNFKLEPIRENVHTKISLPDELLLKCHKKLGCKKGILTTVIKAEIRKCIRKNLPAFNVKKVSYAEMRLMFEQMLCRVDERIDGIGDSKQRSKLILKLYHQAMNELIDELRQITYKEVNKNG